MTCVRRAEQMQTRRTTAAASAFRRRLSAPRAARRPDIHMHIATHHSLHTAITRYCACTLLRMPCVDRMSGAVDGDEQTAAAAAALARPDSSDAASPPAAPTTDTTQTHTTHTNMEMDSNSSSTSPSPGSAGVSVVAAGTAPRPRAASTSKRSHPLLPSAILTPASVGLHVSLSPRSEAKRIRTGEHTPGGSVMTTAQWATDVPMSPATALLQQAFVKLAPSTPSSAGTHTAAQTKLAFAALAPSPSPSRDHAAALPPTHPISPLANPFGGLLSSAPAAGALSTASVAAGAMAASPTRSNPSSAASSPSLISLSGSNGSAVSSTAADGISPAPLSPTATQLHTAHSVASPQAHHLTAPAAAAVAPGTLSTPRRVTQSATSARTTPPDLDEADEEDEHMANSSSSAKKTDNRQGASCHQCKTTKDEQHLLFCTTKAGGSRKRRCRKKYCDSCLSRTYGVAMPSLLASPALLATWQCPSCAGKCTCAGCTRKGGASGRSAVVMPPTPVESVPAPTKAKSTKQQQQQQQQQLLQQQREQLEHAAAWSGAQALPAAGFISARAASAPGAAFAHFSDDYHLGSANGRLPAHSQQHPDGLPLAVGGTVPDVSAPQQMDAIASLLLELSTTANMTSSVAQSSGPSDASVMVAAQATKPISPSETTATTPLHAGVSPAKLAAAQAVDSARLAALRSGRPLGSSLPLAPFTFGASSTSSVASPAASAYSSSRFSASPVSLLQSSSSSVANGPFAMRSSPHLPLQGQPAQQQSAYTRYAAALNKLTNAPPLGQRATSESTLAHNRTSAATLHTPQM